MLVSVRKSRENGGVGDEETRLLGRPADEATRRIALDLLDDANAGASRLREGDDDEALHDFRVAIRRLRSIGRAHARHLDDALCRKRLKRLARIQRATGAARDAEVQREWVSGWREQFSPEEIPGVDAFVDRLEVETPSPEDALKHWAKLEKTLRKELRVVTRDIFVQPDGYGPVLAGLARNHASHLALELESVHHEKGEEQMRAIHDARIAGKRLRYLVEPIRRDEPNAAVLVKRCKHLQDLLGDIHDMHVLIENACTLLATAGPWERVGLAAIVRLASEHSTRLETQLAGEHDARELDFVALTETMARAIEGDSGENESREIERKYLLRGLPEAVRGVEAAELAQGYLPGGEIRERLRRVRKGGRTTYLRTLKAGRGLSRIEVEEEVSAELFNPMWVLTQGARVHKKRYAIPAGELVWEIDEFLDRELVLAEVELPSEETEVVIPDWLAPHVEREVTDEPDYVNQNLAR